MRLEEAVLIDEGDRSVGLLDFDIDVNKSSGGADGNVGAPGTTRGGTIQAHHMILRAEGNLTANVEVLEAVPSYDYSVQLIDVGGDLIGDVDADNGDGVIERVLVGGDIGSSGSEVSIIASLGIGDVAADSIFAIIAPRASSEIARPIRRVEARSGDFAGYLVCSGFDDTLGSGTPGLFVDGEFAAIMYVDEDLTAPIEIAGDVVAGARIETGGDMDAPIGIAGDLQAGATIEIGDFNDEEIILGSNGLKRQIIVDSNNNPDSPIGDIIVGATTLSPWPLYTNIGLGGGAVGEVPFGCHLQDSVPATSAGGDPGTTTDPDQVVELHFYGPVTWDTEVKPFTVVCCIGGFCNNAITETAHWSVVNSPGSLVLSIQRDSDLADNSHYHVFPTEDLLCDGINASEVPVRESEFTFEVELP